MVLTFGLLAIQTVPSVHAQGRRGMMMSRQMMMNGAMLNPNLAWGRRWEVYTDPYAGWAYAADYSRKDDANSKPKIRKYWKEELALSPEEERERRHQIELAWSQSDSSVLEPQTTTALNILLDDLRDLQSKGIRAPDMALDTESLGRLNVRLRRTNGNPGVLKNNGQLDWPVFLQGPEFKTDRELISRLAPQLIEQARHGQVHDLARFAGAVQNMHQNLHARIADTPAPAYVRAKRFLTQIDEAIKILGQPDAGNYFNQLYAVRGNSVGELVRHMTLLDLHFAPAVEGDATAYQALHKVLAAYDRAAHEQLVASNHRK
jgi:hypothetical protein